jgi:two-component system phosphate regulon sensor histidine kinase PhoR
MAQQLNERITIITRQHNEQEAILSSMTESVIAIDANRKILTLNPAAVNLFGTTLQEAKGRGIHEVIRNSELQGFIDLTIASDSPVERNISILSDTNDYHLQAHGNVLRSSNNKAIGALMVLTDITRLRKLENIRKEFVANVSHELRTPLTAIKGFVETLQTDEFSRNENAERFLSIISNKVDGLCTIVEDLLSLSSIERDSERKEILFEKTTIHTVISSAITSCSKKASQKKITITPSGDDIACTINIPMLEQAIVNLLDNAINYSSDNGCITIIASKEHDNLTIKVQDFGIGIPQEHQPRIFERFYRVDKARSRKLGGSGLGLSIVKNIALAHGGTVNVESEINSGSTFTISLPVNPTDMSDKSLLLNDRTTENKG